MYSDVLTRLMLAASQHQSGQYIRLLLRKISTSKSGNLGHGACVQDVRAYKLHTKWILCSIRAVSTLEAVGRPL